MGSRQELKIPAMLRWLNELNHSKNAEVMRYWYRGLQAACVSVMLSGCFLAPGLYVDNISIEKMPLPEEEALGGEVSIFPVTAELVRRLKDEQAVRLRRNRIIAHQLYEENAQLKGRYEYRIGHTDILSIVVWGHPELSVAAASVQQGELPRPVETVMLTSDMSTPGHEVGADGNIFYPYIGLTNVSGKTLAEIRQQITEQISRYIPNPQVDVGVSQFRSQRAYVVGEVEAERTLPITQVPLEIIDALTLVGGLTDRADTRNAILVRDGQEYHVDLQAILNGDLTQNYFLRDQDVLAIPDNRFNSVFVMGEFDHNIRLAIPPSRFFSLADAISGSEVGGFTPEIDPQRIFVFRYRETQGQEEDSLYPDVYHLDADSAEKMLLAANFPLLPRDIIYAAPTGLARWNRTVLRLLPTIRAIFDPVRTYWFIDDTTTNRARDRDRD